MHFRYKKIIYSSIEHTTYLVTRMTTDHIGRIDVFDTAIETWTTYDERLEIYYTVKEVNEKKKILPLLRLVGANTYKLLRNLTAQTVPKFMAYEEINEKDHYSPKPSMIT